MDNFLVIEEVLRKRTSFFSDIRDSLDLQGKCMALLISCITFFTIYGAVMGASHGLLQALSSAVKLPILFIVTFIICAPALYFFNLLFGSNETLMQHVTLILTAMTITAVLLLSLAPITFFFLISSNQYTFFKLLNVVFFAVSGSLGLVFLRVGMNATADPNNKQGVEVRQMIFLLWMLLYAFVGSQMAWTLSPFMGEPGLPFILFTQPGGNFWSDVVRSIRLLFGK